MADLGTIGRLIDGDLQCSGSQTLTQTTAKPNHKFSNQNPEGRITGTVSVGGTPAAQHLVMLIDRNTRQIVRTTYSGAAGAFQFDGLQTDSRRYMVMVQDEGEPDSYNSRTADKVLADDPNT